MNRQNRSVVETNRQSLLRDHCVEDRDCTFRELAINNDEALFRQTQAQAEVGPGNEAPNSPVAMDNRKFQSAFAIRNLRIEVGMLNVLRSPLAEPQHFNGS